MTFSSCLFMLWIVIQSTHALINCSDFGTEFKIRDKFPFDILWKQSTADLLTTYAIEGENSTITELHIADKTCIPKFISCFQHLQKLVISNTSLCNLASESIFEIEYLPSSLVDLQLSNMNIKHLSRGISILTRLQLLSFTNVPLVSLPNTIRNLPALKFLSITNSTLRRLPAGLQNLESLTLKNNLFLDFLQSIDNSPVLTTLVITSCPMPRLPANLSNLVDLHIISSNLTHLDGIETLGVRNNKPKRFHFLENSIRSISKTIKQVRNLSRLNLKYNQLSGLPNEFYNITTLKYLNLKKNRFRPYEKDITRSRLGEIYSNVKTSPNFCEIIL
ncbi:unnamed protein product [Adineta ricciae]|uniref:Uncharacterized protein n=1 Tax=Adineta ricciae TaxID=249248 RepID=A0A815R379_ADIRI|nr:unnamed protein product [Adineta ricciae]CAF1471839.1 unnamed protein product [Adineta ricciae]